MRAAGVVFGHGVALALGGDDVQQHRLGQALGAHQKMLQPLLIVPIHRAQVAEAEGLEKPVLHEHVADMILPPLQQMVQRPAHQRRLFQCLGYRALGAQPALAGAQVGEVAADRAHIGRDAHLVVIEDNNQPGAAAAGIVHGLVAHAAGERAIAHHGDDMPLLALQIPRAGQAQGGRNGGGGMAGAVGIVLAFLPLGEAGDTLILAQGIHLPAPAGQYLVGIALMPYIKHNFVRGAVKHAVQGDGQFHHAQVAGQVAACAGHRVHNLLAQQGDQFLHLLLGHLLQLLRGHIQWQFHHALLGTQWCHEYTTPA